MLYVHKRAKMVATITKLQNFSSIRYMDPITKILYHNYTIAACNPLYPNVVKLEEGSFQQYGETLKKFNLGIYQWSMNSNCINTSMDHSLFFLLDVT